MAIDIDQFTIGDLEIFEDKTGLLLTKLDFNALPIKAITYLIWLDKRRSDETYTIEQADSVTGGNNKALDFAVYYDKEGTVDLTAVGTWTRNTRTATNTVATTSGSEAMVIVEFDAADWDAEGGFTFVQCSVSDPGAACPGSGVWHLMGARYAQQITDSALV